MSVIIEGNMQAPRQLKLVVSEHIPEDVVIINKKTMLKVFPGAVKAPEQTDNVKVEVKDK